MAKPSYEQQIIGYLKLNGYELSDIAKMRGCCLRTLKNKLKEPDNLDRQTLRLFHKYGKVPLEVLI